MKQPNGRNTWIAVGTVWCALIVIAQMLFASPKVGAYALLIQSTSAVANARTAAVAYPTTPRASHLLVVVCGSRVKTTFSTPAGFSVAKNEAGTPSQGIFYKVSAGNEATITCTGTTSGRMGIHIYEYSGTLAASPFELVNPVSATGTGTAQLSGSLTTTNANDMLFAAITSNVNATFSAWSNTFVERRDFLSGTQAHFGSADQAVAATGTYTTTATSSASGAWRGQIAAFKLMPIQLMADIVDAGGVAIANPSVTMNTQTFGFGCQTSTGSFGVASQKLRISNTTVAPAWELSIAPTAGPTALWSDGVDQYDMNDPTTVGCDDGIDADTKAGQLTINPSTATITPGTGCTTTGVTLGVSTAFSQNVTDSIVVAAGGASTMPNCLWDITGLSLSQTIPAEQSHTATGYTMSLTLTIVSK